MAEYRNGYRVDEETGLTKPEERAGLTREDAEAQAQVQAGRSAQRTTDIASSSPNTPLAPAAPPPLDESVAGAEYERLKKKVKQGLEANLSPDEVIRVIVSGAHGQAIIGTDTRAFVCKPGFAAGASFGV